MLFITGALTSISLFNSVQDAIKIKGSNNSLTESTNSVNTDFNLFNLSSNTLQSLSAFPPLKSPFGEYQSSPGVEVLSYQKIGDVVTKYPLISFYQSLNSKIGIIAGEGIWRWRNYDFLQHGTGESFNELMTRMIQFLCVKPDDKQFSITTENSRKTGNEKMFSENEPVIFSGQLFNDTREAINSPDVKLLIRDSRGKEYNYTMNRSGSGYSLNAGSFSTEKYSYTASATFNGKTLIDKGIFIISPLQLENTTTHADFQLLNLISTKSGGKMFYANQISELENSIVKKENIKPVIYMTQKTESLINLKWLFFFFAGLLGIEWFARKINGGY